MRRRAARLRLARMDLAGALVSAFSSFMVGQRQECPGNTPLGGAWLGMDWKGPAWLGRLLRIVRGRTRLCWACRGPAWIVPDGHGMGPCWSHFQIGWSCVGSGQERLGVHRHGMGPCWTSE